MSRLVTPGEIEELYDFCYLQSVVHYDVQVELVDHLASAIEEIWVKNPHISFDDALYMVNEQFGGHAGFVIIKQEKEKALRREYQKMLWKFVAEFYRLPKIILTAGISLLIFYCLKYAANDVWIIGALLVLVAIFSFYFLFIYFPKHIKIKKDGYALLLNEVLSKGVAYKTLVVSGGILSTVTRLNHISTVGSIVFSALFSLYLILLYADCFVIPLRVKEHFTREFPQFVKA